MIRRKIEVDLPNPGAFPGTPSGDNDYDEACNKAIAAAIPLGFRYVRHEGKQERIVRNWAVVEIEGPGCDDHK